MALLENRDPVFGIMPWNRSILQWFVRQRKRPPPYLLGDRCDRIVPFCQSLEAKPFARKRTAQSKLRFLFNYLRTGLRSRTSVNIHPLPNSSMISTPYTNAPAAISSSKVVSSRNVGICAK